jgi:cytoskeletal protein RodZ
MFNKIEKQSGSAHVIVIGVLVFAVLGLIGFVFWQNFIIPKNQSQKTGTTQTSTSATDPQIQPSTVPSSNATYSGVNFSFQYPTSGWTINKTKYVDTAPLTPELKTNDYATMGMGVDKGAIVSLNVTDSLKSIDEVYLNRSNLQSGLKPVDLRRATTNGMPSVTYNSAYEGIRYHTVLVHGGKEYDFVYMFQDGTDAATYMDTYSLVTSTFTFI